MLRRYKSEKYILKDRTLRCKTSQQSGVTVCNYSGQNETRKLNYKYEEGILIIDFVDAKTKKMFWRGTAKANVENVDTPEKSWTIIKAAVNEILKKYPPPSD